ncbi:hypothetical protein IAT38_007577 [Cryptococcus sp. DSM 104549]
MPAATTPVETSVEVKGLGRLTGWLNADGTKQFFNVRYADIAKRFTHSTLKTSWPEQQWEGRYLGAASPQPIRPFYPFPMPERPALKYDDLEIQDEFECCNLHITLPPGCSFDDELPVMVFIHGGGFVFGTANYSMLDGRHLAVLSAELGMPTIIITPNYRLGFYGFLASHDFAEECPEGNGNFGLIDQKNALFWVNKSGTIPICGMYTVDEYDVIYQKLLHEVGIDATLPAKDRLEALRAVSTDVLSQATYECFQGLNLPQFGVCHDGKIIGDGVPLPTPGSYWKQDLSKVYNGKVIVGDCKNEGIIYDQAFKDYPVSHLRDLASKHLPPTLVQPYLEHYSVRDDMSELEKFNAVESMVTDGIFGASPAYLAEANPDKVYVYHWDHASQFKNAWGGYAHHSLDYMWLFGNVSAIVSPQERELIRAIGTDFITFANGIDPFPSYGAEKNARRYGPLSTWSVVDEKYDGRPFEWFVNIGPHLDAVDALCTDIIMRRPQLVSPEYGPGSKNRVKVTQGKPMAL